MKEQKRFLTINCKRKTTFFQTCVSERIVDVKTDTEEFCVHGRKFDRKLKVRKEMITVTENLNSSDSVLCEQHPSNLRIHTETNIKYYSGLHIQQH